MSNTKSIINGWYNIIISGSTNESNRRKDICVKCKYSTKLGFCIKCGCYINAKVTVKSSKCPENKW